MPTAFTGNAAYCFSNSLHMTLLGSGAAPGTVGAVDQLALDGMLALWRLAASN